MIFLWRCRIILIFWTDGSREDYSSIGGFEVAGAGTYLPASEIAFDHSVWGTVEEYGDARLERCCAFLPVPGVLQSVQRAEFWGANCCFASLLPCHLGIDNLNVVRSIGSLLDADCLAKPLALIKDGDLIALVQHMIRARSRDTVRVTKVKGMLKRLMFIREGFVWWISRAMLRLMCC